jgi:hypothetical protein
MVCGDADVHHGCHRWLPRALPSSRRLLVKPSKLAPRQVQRAVSPRILSKSSTLSGRPLPTVSRRRTEAGDGVPAPSCRSATFGLGCGRLPPDPAPPPIHARSGQHVSDNESGFLASPMLSVASQPRRHSAKAEETSRTELCPEGPGSVPPPRRSATGPLCCRRPRR